MSKVNTNQVIPQPVLLEALAAHELFRTLGYSAADIYMNLADSGLEVLVKEGDISASVRVSKTCPSLDSFSKEWRQAVRWWSKEAVESERQSIFESSNCRRDAVKIVANMIFLGMHPGRFN